MAGFSLITQSTLQKIATYILLNLEQVSSASNLKSLHRLYDLVESHVRSLKFLGVSAESYGSLLSPILFNKIPSKLQLTRKMVPITDASEVIPLIFGVLERRYLYTYIHTYIHMNCSSQLLLMIIFFIKMIQLIIIIMYKLLGAYQEE